MIEAAGKFLTGLIPGFSWIRAGLMLAGALAIAAAIGTVLHWRSQAHQLADWQSGIVLTVTDATVPMDAKGRRKALKPNAVPLALVGLIDDRNDARRALAAISVQAQAAKQRSDADDVDLTRTQGGNDAKLQGALKEITRLKAATSTGDAAADAALIDSDSEDAWRGWK